MKFSIVFVMVFLAHFSTKVEGHGYLIVPPNRASLWRIDGDAPINYNDNEFFCGGTFRQYFVNGGECGPCGDDWEDPVPRSNENGGIFGRGRIVANYSAGSLIESTVMITANHLGSLYFHLCDLSETPDAPETEECFKPLFLGDGTTHYSVNPLDLRVDVVLRLPDDVLCEHCVLRWHYRTGNSWGLCPDGSQNMGCGNQEVFRSCADIRITPPSDILPQSSEEDDWVSKERQPPPTPLPPKDGAPCVLPENFRNPHARREFHYKHRF